MKNRLPLFPIRSVNVVVFLKEKSKQSTAPVKVHSFKTKQTKVVESGINCFEEGKDDDCSKLHY